MFNFNSIKKQRNIILFLSIIGLSVLPIAAIAEPQINPNQQRGNKIEINGNLINIPWHIDQSHGNSKIAIKVSDIGLMQNLGIDLLDTNNSSQQPIQWFSSQSTLSAEYINPHRYLDLSNFAASSQWQIKPEGSNLKITIPPSNIQSLLIESLSVDSNSPQTDSTFSPKKIIIELDKPTFWQQPKPEIKKRSPSNPSPPSPPLTDDPKTRNPTNSPQPVTPVLQDWILTLDANITPKLLSDSPEFFQPSIPTKSPNLIPPNPNSTNLQLHSQNNQTQIKFSIPPGWRPVVTTSNSPHRLVIEIKPDFLTPKNILWQPGIRWRQDYIKIPKNQASLGSLLNQILKHSESSVDQFPVYWLEININQPDINLTPILSNPDARQGTSALLDIAQQAKVPAAINGGFFNRNNQLPLGAIRLNDNWLSSPILNRGVIAWGKDKPILMNRLILKETLTTTSGETVPLQYLNSAYIQSGISRYNSDWGKSYSPINQQENIIVVENNQITRYIEPNKPGSSVVNIPTQGYLLVVRGNPELLKLLPVGTRVQLNSQTAPNEYQNYPNILGAGPLLIQNRQIVLDAAQERFNPAFQQQKAIRSAIAITNNNTLLLVAVHNRPNGSGPSLAELAQILQKLGAVTALNLDGGSSTSLYLGGYYLDRPFSTVAPVHNGLGIAITDH
ncbi:MAG: phosphodiester glycosidase family protein [Planktothrix sp. GU0601_MAG3]|nr:MAG: phosphodiester glycosidase family protein [Planktothrix sp. GU0601_MAG3]